MKTLILAANWGAYFYPWACSSRVCIISPELGLNSPPGFLEQFDKIILVNGIGDEYLFHPRWTQQPRLNTFFFLWDPARCPLYAPTPKKLQRLKRLHKCYSFQREDCRDFGLRFNSTMYAPPPSGLLPEQAEERCDVFFLGVPKDRLPLLRSLHARMSELNLRVFFRIGLTGLEEDVQPERGKGWLLTPEWLGYADYLRLAMQSRCLLDLYQKIQTGFSLRVMEHIFFGRKLITNNRTMCLAKFYHPNNIFILGEDDMRGLRAWLDLPFVPIGDEIRQYYSFDEWIGRFE